MEEIHIVIEFLLLVVTRTEIEWGFLETQNVRVHQVFRLLDEFPGLRGGCVQREVLLVSVKCGFAIVDASDWMENGPGSAVFV